MNPKMKFFDLARKTSLHSNHHSHKIGAVIIRKNRVVSVGFNKLQTHSKSPHPYHSLHAEVSAIIGTPIEDLKNCTLYVFRETKAGVPALSKPCPSCEGYLRLAGIRDCFYSDDVAKGWTYERYK